MSSVPRIPAPTDRLYCLDLLRFLAALAVTLYHLCFHQWALDGSTPVRYPELAAWVSYGCLAVPLFFIISGFVISISMTGKTAGQFARGRFLRLYPMFWICLLLTAITLSVWGTSERQLSAATLLANATMSPHLLHQPYLDDPYWTLQVELRFYAMMFVLLLFRRGASLLTFAAGWLVLSLVDWFWRIPVLHVQLALDSAPFFAAGIVFSEIFRRGARSVHWLLLGMALGLGHLRSLANLREDIGGKNWPVSEVVILCTLAVFFLIFAGIATRKIVLHRRPAFITALGGITYPLYLLHNSIGVTIFQQCHGAINRWLLLTAVVSGFLLLAYGLWRWVEVPLLRKFRSPAPPKTVPRQTIPLTSTSVPTT